MKWNVKLSYEQSVTSLTEIIIAIWQDQNGRQTRMASLPVLFPKSDN